MSVTLIVHANGVTTLLGANGQVFGRSCRTTVDSWRTWLAAHRPTWTIDVVVGGGDQ